MPIVHVQDQHRLQTPYRARVYRVAGWVGEIHCEIEARRRAFRMACPINLPGSRRIAGTITDHEILSAEIRGVLHLPSRLHLTPVLENVVECLLEVHYGLLVDPLDLEPWEAERRIF